MAKGSKAEELYPLPEEERKALISTTLKSEALIAWGGVVGALAVTNLSHGLGYTLRLGWVQDICQALTFHWAMLVLPVVAICLVLLIDTCGKARSESYRKQKLEVAQGVNGELMRVGTGWMLLFAALAGICEELLFRYVLMGVLMFVFGLFFDGLAAAGATVVASSVFFALIHTQYRNPWSIDLVLCLGMIFGIGYLATGSLLVVMITHAVYDAAIMLYERHHMVTDPNYFGGKVPNDVVRQLLASQAKAQAAKKRKASAQEGE